MKKFLYTTIIAMGLGGNLSADNISAHKEFRGASNIQESQENWYRELRIDNWVKSGVSKKKIYSVLNRINSNNILRDKNNEFKPNHWTYEFTKEANKVLDEARSYEQLREASTLYLIASYPNLLTKHEINALNKSVDTYVKAEQLIANNVRKINMNGITGILHLPKEINKKLPVVLWTGGVDKPLVSHLSSIKKYFENEIAVITFDMPGAGLNINSITSIGNESLMHEKALAYVKSNVLFDSSKIAALSSSGAGVPLIEFTLNNPDLKAVVARCTLVDGVLTKPFLLDKLPLMSVQSFGKRIGADINNFDTYAEKTIPLSLKTKGYFDGKVYTDTPLLVINTKKDPVASPEDMKKTAKMSSKGIVKFFGEEGHCPNSSKAEEYIFNFINEYI